MRFGAKCVRSSVRPPAVLGPSSLDPGSLTGKESPEGLCTGDGRTHNDGRKPSAKTVGESRRDPPSCITTSPRCAVVNYEIKNVRRPSIAEIFHVDFPTVITCSDVSRSAVTAIRTERRKQTQTKYT